MGDTAIEWTDKVWNPVTGCSKVSQGCKNCYAERIFQRPYPGRDFTDVQCHEDRLDAPLHWKPGRPIYDFTGKCVGRDKSQSLRVFVNSMSDLFHEKVPFEFIDKIFAMMALCPKHTFQILTKRPERMLAYLTAPDVRARIAREANVFMRSRKRAGDSDALANVFTWGRLENAEVGEYANYLAGITDRCWPLPNIWPGASVEDQPTADQRVPLLQRTPAAVRWVSYEPALGPVDFQNIDWNGSTGLMTLEGPGRLHWVVCGGESGPGARPMHPDWARSVRDQCVAAGVPFFFKQWGQYEPVTPLYRGRDEEAENGRGADRLEMVDTAGRIWGDGDGQPNDDRTWLMERVGKHAAGRLLDGREWNEFPEVA